RTILASAYLDHTTPSIPTLLPYTTLFRSIAEQSKVISKPSPQTAPASRHAVLLRANVLPRRAARHEYSLRRTRQIHCRLQRQYPLFPVESRQTVHLYMVQLQPAMQRMSLSVL